MIELIVDKISFDVEWRLKRNMLIKTVVFALLLFLFYCCFNAEWQEIKPITGQYNSYIYVQGTAPQKEVKNVEKILKKLPKWLVENHIENGGKLSLKTDEFPKSDFTEYGENQRTLGTYNRTTKMITILNDESIMESTIIHEYGHYLDSIFQITGQQEFEEIFIEEKEKYFEKVEKSSYHISCETEYFAGAFSEYITNEKKLKKYCPKTYETIKNYAERN